MVIDNGDDIPRVRVVCYVPIRTNQILQAHASLEGIAKQDLLAGIITTHAETLEVAGLRKEVEKPVNKPVRKKKVKKTSSKKLEESENG